MDVVDKTRTTPIEYDYIAWPSKGYFPTSWFSNTSSFSVTLNAKKYMTPIDSQIVVKVSNLTDGSVTNISSGDFGGLEVNTEGFGNGDAVIAFLPSGDVFSLTPLNAGDEFVIELSGIYKTDGTPTTVKYTVKLFAL